MAILHDTILLMLAVAVYLLDFLVASLPTLITILVMLGVFLIVHSVVRRWRD